MQEVKPEETAPQPKRRTDIIVDPRAIALRPVRANHKKNVFIYYTATTFPDNPWAGCETTIRRLLGNVSAEVQADNYAVLDILAEGGDPIQEVYLTKAGFQYLRRMLHFIVERDD